MQRTFSQWKTEIAKKYDQEMQEKAEAVVDQIGTIIFQECKVIEDFPFHTMVRCDDQEIRDRVIRRMKTLEWCCTYEENSFMVRPFTEEELLVK